MGHEEHRREAPRTLKIFVVTASDTRGEAEDESGAYLKSAAAAAGHAVVGYRIVKDEPVELRAALDAAAAAGAEVILVNGGTGIAARDRTYEAVAGVLEKRIDGFGELFRMLSFAEESVRPPCCPAPSPGCGAAGSSSRSPGRRPRCGSPGRSSSARRPGTWSGSCARTPGTGSLDSTHRKRGNLSRKTYVEWTGQCGPSPPTNMRVPQDIEVFSLRTICAIFLR